MAEKQSKWRIFTAGIIRENPVLRLVLGCCSALAVTTTVSGALGMGCGYIPTMLLMSSVREILGNGTWMGITIIPESIDRMSLMNQAPGGFFVFGCLMALCVYIEKKLNKPIERKTCGDVMLEEIDKAKTEEGGAKE